MKTIEEQLADPESELSRTLQSFTEILSAWATRGIQFTIVPTPKGYHLDIKKLK